MVTPVENGHGDWFADTMTQDLRFVLFNPQRTADKASGRVSGAGPGNASEGVEDAAGDNAPGEDAIDGLKVDREGNVYVSGPGGLWIFSPAGTHLGTIAGPEQPHNFAWGDADGKTLYLAAQTGLYRIRLGIAGMRAFGVE